MYRRNTTLSSLDERTWLWLDTVPLHDLTPEHSGRIEYLQSKFKIRHATAIKIIAADLSSLR